MNIEFDAATSYPSTGGSVAEHTFSHPTAGPGAIVFVGFMHYTDNSDIVSGVTYDGVAMTRVDSVALSGSRLYLYMLRAPATGTKNVVVSLSTSRDIYGGVTSYKAVKQSGAIDSSNNGTISSATSITVSTTSVADNCWLVGVYASQAGRTMSAGTDTTQRVTNSAAFSMYDSNAAKTPAGSHSLQVSLNSTDTGALIVASFDPGTDSGQSAAFLTL